MARCAFSRIGSATMKVLLTGGPAGNETFDPSFGRAIFRRDIGAISTTFGIGTKSPAILPEFASDPGRFPPMCRMMNR